MEYFKILNLTREPFSNSPDPEFFYESPHHVDCLQQLEMALRLRRGLNVVTGDVGTGKTTLCRQLIRQLSWDRGIATHLLLDPNFDTPESFLVHITGLLGIPPVEQGALTEWGMKETIKNHLFRQSLEQGQVTVLIIDEGQTLPSFGLEILREFLNYETNECKLLQIVIFAQREFRKVLKAHPGFADRINLLFHLKPLSFGDAKSMILFRIRRAAENGVTPIRFTLPALLEIHRATGGYPRKMVMLCHQILLLLIIRTRDSVSWFLVRETLRRTGSLHFRAGYVAGFAGLAALLAVFFLIQFGSPAIREGVMSPFASWFGGWVHPKNETVLPVAANSDRTAEPVPPDSMGKSDTTGAEPSPAAVPLPAVSHAEETSPVSGSSPEPPPAAVPPAVTPPAAIEPPKPAAPPETAVRKEPEASPERPAILGRLTVSRGDIIWKLMSDVYGTSTIRNMNIFKKANPHLRNVNRIAAGDVLHFPAIEAAVAPSPLLFWAALAESGDLAEIFRSFRKYPQDFPQVRILCWWNRNEGLRFAMALQKPFDSEKAAWQALDAIQQGVSASARILSKWDEGTVFFSDVGAS